MFQKILIANRGEIACRIIKTAHRMGIIAVAIYSTADQNSLHVTLADEAFCVGPPAAIDSYLNIEAIIAIAKAAQVEAIHPGYGFLSENAAFAQACAEAGIVFIGPSIAAMTAMASKQVAKQILEKTGVPLTPGYHGCEQADKHLLQAAEHIGFPVLLKAAAGGGGKGMRVVEDESLFLSALAGARREAKASFADETMIIEKLITNPRHVEMQIMADNHGHVVHLFERDCSIQRRHQKIIEEAPAPKLAKTLRQALAKAAIEVAKAIDYRGAGTIEFLVADDQFYFMEMNTRLQVEHPVTEMITGLDLVEWQLRIAANESLPLTQAGIQAYGHAIECRIYAEDPTHDFMPSIGQIHFLHEPPTNQYIRLDTGMTKTSEVTRYYDPMLAKLIAWGESREQAIAHLQHALRHYHIGGVKTNIAFLQAILQQKRFAMAKLSTAFLTEQTLDIPTPDPQHAVFWAACVDYLNLRQTTDPLQQAALGWQLHLKPQWIMQYQIMEKVYRVAITPLGVNQLHVKVTIDQHVFEKQIQVKLIGQQLHYQDGQAVQMIDYERRSEQLIFYTACGPIAVSHFQWQNQPALAVEHSLIAPMPATIVAILKKIGDTIKAGDSLMVLEAMKMEHTIHAPHDGLLADIYYEVGAQVNEGAELVALCKES